MAHEVIVGRWSRVLTRPLAQLSTSGSLAAIADLAADEPRSIYGVDINRVLVFSVEAPHRSERPAGVPPIHWKASPLSWNQFSYALELRRPHQTGGLSGDASIREPKPPLDLDAALKDLDEADDEAREEGFDPPAELAVKNARRLLQCMYTTRPCRYEVYPTSDREMAIYVPEGRRSVLVTCAPDGSARCSTSLGRKRSRTYYDPAYVADPPLGFLREALAALDAS